MRAAGVLAALLLACGGCGYRVVEPSVGGGRRIAVPIAANETRWRGAEVSLTGYLRTDLQRLLDLELANQPAPLVLHTAIVDVSREAPVRDRSGAALAGAVTLQVNWKLENGGGESLGEGQVRRTLEFIPSESEDAGRAIVEMLDSIAEFVVIEVGTRLEGGSIQS